MKKFSKKTGRIFGRLSLIMIFVGVIFIGLAFTRFGWWLDNAVFSPLAKTLHISLSAWFWFLRFYVVAAIMLAVLAGYFTER